MCGQLPSVALKGSTRDEVFDLLEHWSVRMTSHSGGEPARMSMEEALAEGIFGG